MGARKRSSAGSSEVIGATISPVAAASSSGLSGEEVAHVALADADHDRLGAREIDDGGALVRLVAAVEHQVEPMAEPLLDVPGVDEGLPLRRRGGGREDRKS